MDTLEDLAAAGYIVDGWDRWQQMSEWKQGDCGLYALALISLEPSLHFGVLGVSDDDESSGIWYERHYFAHDGLYAYDSAGRHTLPYHGVHGDCDVVVLDQTPEDFGVQVGMRTASLAAAVAHASRHSVLTSTPHVAAS